MSASTTSETQSEQRDVAQSVRAACIDTAVSAYRTARMDGLCHEGAWESAVSAMERLDIDTIVAEAQQSRK